MSKTTSGREETTQPTAGKRRGFIRDNLIILRFLVTTLASIIFLFAILHWDVVERSVVVPYTSFVASASRVTLRLLGVQADGSGSLISSPEFAVSILNVCNGLEVTAIFFATVLGFPASWKSKILGIALGYPTIFIINIGRIVVLFLLGFKKPDIFENVHYYYAQAFVILATLGVWLLWVSKCSSYAAKKGSSVSG